MTQLTPTESESGPWNPPADGAAFRSRNVASPACQRAFSRLLRSCQGLGPDTCLRLANFLSAFWAPCKAPKYSFSIRFLIERMIFGRLARRPKALKKFATDEQAPWRHHPRHASAREAKGIALAVERRCRASTGSSATAAAAIVAAVAKVSSAICCSAMSRLPYS